MALTEWSFTMELPLRIPSSPAGWGWVLIPLTVLPDPTTGPPPRQRLISTAPNGCLTFWFRSDGATTSTGWEATFSCTLPPECAAPSTLIATTITSLGANLGWTENGTATHWDIEIGASGFSPTGIPTYEDVDTNPFQWSEGAFETSYDFYVRTDCEASGGVGQSNWVGPFTFTTLCGVYVPDYAQDFSTFLPNCWEVGKGHCPVQPQLVFPDGKPMVLPIMEKQAL